MQVGHQIVGLVTRRSTDSLKCVCELLNPSRSIQIDRPLEEQRTYRAIVLSSFTLPTSSLIQTQVNSDGRSLACPDFLLTADDSTFAPDSSIPLRLHPSIHPASPSAVQPAGKLASRHALAVGCGVNGAARGWCVAILRFQCSLASQSSIPLTVVSD